MIKIIYIFRKLRICRNADLEWRSEYCILHCHIMIKFKSRDKSSISCHMKYIVWYIKAYHVIAYHNISYHSTSYFISYSIISYHFESHTISHHISYHIIYISNFTISYHTPTLFPLLLPFLEHPSFDSTKLPHETLSWGCLRRWLAIIKPNLKPNKSQKYWKNILCVSHKCLTNVNCFTLGRAGLREFGRDFSPAMANGFGYSQLVGNRISLWRV